MKEINLEQDEYGLYKSADNYHAVRQEMDAHYHYYESPRAKMNKIPKWIRWLFGAL